MEHPQLNLPTLKRPRTAVSDGGGDPASASDSPTPTTPLDRSAGHAIRAAHPSGSRAVDDNAGVKTKLNFRRTR